MLPPHLTKSIPQQPEVASLQYVKENIIMSQIMYGGENSKDLVLASLTDIDSESEKSPVNLGFVPCLKMICWK